MASPSFILALFFTSFYLFPSSIKAQQHPFTAILLPQQNPLEPENLTKPLIFLFLGLIVGAAIVVVAGIILYFIFGQKKTPGPSNISSQFLEAQKMAFVNQLPDSLFKTAYLKVKSSEDSKAGTENFHGDMEVVVKKI